MIPTAFDAVAATYDDEFTRSPLGLMLRQRVWQVLSAQFRAGERLLELACGTGADAIWLARHGIQMLATDGAAAMVQQAAAKVAQAGLTDRVTVRQLTLQQIVAQDGALPALPRFDGALSNFGGLNIIPNWRPLAQALAQLVRPGGRLVLVPMGPFCPWEIGWFGLHGQWRTAWRRLRQPPARARIGSAEIPIWYPSPRRLQHDFAPWFTQRQTESLGLWLPPSALSHLVARWPKLFAKIGRFEQKTAHLSRGWGDHYIMVLERKETA